MSDLNTVIADLEFKRGIMQGQLREFEDKAQSAGPEAQQYAVRAAYLRAALESNTKAINMLSNHKETISHAAA